MAQKQHHSLQSLWQQWENDYRGALADATLKRYVGIGHRFSAWFEDETGYPPMLDDWDAVSLAGYYEHLKPTVQPQTLNTHFSALRHFGDWLVQVDVTQHNPARRLKLIKRQPSNSPTALTTKQVNALFRSVKLTRNPLRNAAIIMLMLQTGLRVGECAQLRCGDLVIGERHGAVTVRDGKGGKMRRVPLNQSARQGLADYFAPQFQCEPTLKNLAKNWPQLSSEKPIWMSERGTPLSVRAMEGMFQQQVALCTDRYQLPDKTTLHSLRHTFAKHYLKQHPGDLVGLAFLLGHSSIRTTQVYVRPTDVEIAQRVDDLPLNIYSTE